MEGAAGTGVIMEPLGRFSANSLNATPAMMVDVTKNGKPIKSYRTPRGFRLDQYVGYLHPGQVIRVIFNNRENAQRPDFTVIVTDEYGQEIEVHNGVYDNIELA